MKLMKKEFALGFLVLSVVSLAVCEREDLYVARQEELDAALAITQRLLQHHELRIAEKERKLQAMKESFNGNMEPRMNLTSVLEELDDISRSSTRDMRRLIKAQQHKRHAALEASRKGLELEEKEMGLLHERRRRARNRLLHSKQEEEAIVQASLQQTEALASKIEDALDVAERLHHLQQMMNLVTERAVELRKATPREGILSKWLHRLSSLFLERNTSKATYMDNNVTPKGTSTSSLETYQSLVPMSVMEHEDWNSDPADGSDDKAEQAAENDDPENSEAEAEEASDEEDPVDVPGLGTNTEDLEVLEISGPDTDSEAPSPPDDHTYEMIGKGGATVPIQVEAGGASPKDHKQNRPKRSFMWLVYMFVVLSLVVGAVRVYCRFYDRRRLGAVAALACTHAH